MIETNNQNTWPSGGPLMILGGRVFGIKINSFVVAGVGAPGHSNSIITGPKAKSFARSFNLPVRNC